jgi:hypothetical protein
MQEVLHNQILDDSVHVLDFVVLKLCQVISVLLLGHLESPEVVSPRVVDQTREVHCPEET